MSDQTDPTINVSSQAEPTNIIDEMKLVEEIEPEEVEVSGNKTVNCVFEEVIKKVCQEEGEDSTPMANEADPKSANAAELYAPDGPAPKSPEEPNPDGPAPKSAEEPKPDGPAPKSPEEKLYAPDGSAQEKVVKDNTPKSAAPEIVETAGKTDEIGKNVVEDIIQNGEAPQLTDVMSDGEFAVNKLAEVVGQDGEGKDANATATADQDGSDEYEELDVVDPTENDQDAPPAKKAKEE